MNEKYIGYDKGTSDETIITMKLKDYQALERKLEVAVKKLELYGDRNNWRYSSNNDLGAFDAWLDFKPDHFCKKHSELGGYHARQALAEIKGE